LELTRARLGNGLAVGSTAALLARDLDLPTLVSYWGERTPLVIAAAVILAGLWTTRLRPVVAAVTACLALAWLVIAFTPLTPWMARDLPRRDAEAPADAAFVLASRIQDDGELTTTAMSRLVHALELLGQDKASRLVLSELPSPYAPFAPAARTLMAHLGLKQELLTVGPVSSTRDEAVLVSRLFRERGWRRVLLVTSPTHTRRAAASFEREGLLVVSSPATETRFDLELLARPDDRLFAFGSLLHERVGIQVYRYRGWME
jgi:uncharacterized SAM-binding protein YcdF (DUF218 family)